MPANGLLITCSNIHELTSSDILSFSSKEYWHKFILKNGGLYDKEAVLLAVLDSVAPFDLVPVKYTVEGSDAYFLARNCGLAIEKFCLNLLYPIRLMEPPGEVIVSIQTCSIPIEQYKMNMQYHLKKAIEKRYDESQKGFIDLSSFHKEPGLNFQIIPDIYIYNFKITPDKLPSSSKQTFNDEDKTISELFEVLFCPLSKPKFLAYVLSILKRHLSIMALSLSNNSIENVESLEVLGEFKGLVSLDLSNNMIKDPRLAVILGKTVPGLQALNLHGNPVCNIFKMDADYLKWIKDKLQSIKVIDGISLNNGIPNHQVYFCSEKPLGIIDAFLRHYFTLYDDNRQSLEHTYEKNAIFSLTCDSKLSAKNLKDSKLECYQFESKNLLKVNDENKIIGISHQTNINVAKVLCKFPLTEHDPFSFKVDMLFYQEPFIVLVVSGIFKDFQEAPRIRSFSRTFALRRIAGNEFKITNDLYHVRNATNDEIDNSFLYSKPRINKPELETLLTKDEEQNLIEVLSRLTEMNSAYSKKCLEECKWDMKKALEVFLENYQNFNIPPEAFTEDFSN